MRRYRRAAGRGIALALLATSCAPRTELEARTALETDTWPASASECLDGGEQLRLEAQSPAADAAADVDALPTDRIREQKVGDLVTLDLRGTVLEGDQLSTSPTYNPKPINIGGTSQPEGLCVVGGLVHGTHPRTMPWSAFKEDPGGGDMPALRIGGTGWAVVDGFRVNNMANGIRPVGDGLLVRNAYFDYIRDDCIENDELKDVRVEDSLFDGCFAAFSQRPGRDSPLWHEPRDDSRLELVNVLVRMQRMPGGHRVEGAETWTSSHLFKWSVVAGQVSVVDSVFMVGDNGTDLSRRYDWPDDVIAENVTLVWVGEGPYPGRLPETGVTVTRDRSVWDRVKADWLQRHGCLDVMRCDTDRLLDPVPPRPHLLRPSKRPLTVGP